MATIVIRQNGKAIWLTGLASLRAKACQIIQRAMAYAAATVLICAAGAALLNSLRRHLRIRALSNGRSLGQRRG